MVVAHGGVIGSFIAQIEGISPNDWRRHPIANCSLTHLHVTAEHTAVHLFNDAVHLEMLNTDQVEPKRMKLTGMLGGSAAGPGPGQGCSGYLVESGDSRIVLDLGPGTLPELRRHTDYRTLDGIIISHMHLDHVLGSARSPVRALRTTRCQRRCPIPLWLPPDGSVVLHRAGAAFLDV